MLNMTNAHAEVEDMAVGEARSMYYKHARQEQQARSEEAAAQRGVAVSAGLRLVHS